MKKNTFIKGLAMALTCALAITAFTPAISPVTAEAATRKVTASKSWKKAKTVKTGTTIVTSNNKSGKRYIKFKAPKAGKYVFTVYDIKSSGKNEIGYGHIGFKTISNNYLFGKNVKTKGGKDAYLRLATKYSYNRFEKGQKVTTHSYLYKRTGTVTLKKGQTIYLESFFSGNKTKYTYKLNIKRK